MVSYQVLSNITVLEAHSHHEIHVSVVGSTMQNSRTLCESFAGKTRIDQAEFKKTKFFVSTFEQQHCRLDICWRTEPRCACRHSVNTTVVCAVYISFSQKNNALVSNVWFNCLVAFNSPPVVWKINRIDYSLLSPRC